MHFCNVPEATEVSADDKHIQKVQCFCSPAQGQYLRDLFWPSQNLKLQALSFGQSGGAVQSVERMQAVIETGRIVRERNVKPLKVQPPFRNFPLIQ